jgi:hypothetical protein
MYNQYTDCYKIVEVEVIKALPYWGRDILAIEDFSLQQFRKKEYVNSLRPYVKKPGSKPPSMRVENGDAIYKIDLRERSIPFVGSFKTEDNFVRVYDFTLILKVSDPEICARRYSVGKDPVFLAIDSIRKALKKYGKKHEHDQLTKLGKPSLDWNKGLVNETGIQILEITKWILHEDRKRLETAKIEQVTAKKVLKLQREVETGLIRERSERERDALQHMYLLHRQLSSTAAVELKAILQERIRDAFESGQSIDKVAKDTLDLLNALYKGIEDFSFAKGIKNNQNGAFPGENGTSAFKNGDQFEGATTILAGKVTGNADDDMPPIDELKK